MEFTNKHFLYPATLYASKAPTLVTTILGTCVAVCLFDPVAKIGGINHFMLAQWDGSSPSSPKYGDVAIRNLYDKMLQQGAEKSNLHARIYGGLCRKGGGDAFNIGIKNILIAKKMLSQLHIPVRAQDVGGHSPRKLGFQTNTGLVKMDLLLPEVVMGNNC